MNTKSGWQGACIFGLFLLGCSAQPISPTPTATETGVATATATDQPLLTPSFTAAPSLTPTNMPSVLCPQGDTILFHASNWAEGSDGIYQLCEMHPSPVLIVPETPDTFITRFDALSDGTLVYEIGIYDVWETYVVIQAAGQATPERIEALDGLQVAFPKWVLNGSHILFIGSTNSENPSDVLFAFNVQTQAVYTLYEKYTLHHLNVAPDGETILFTASTGRQNEKVPVMVGALACDEECQLLNLHSVDNVATDPIWARNGNAIASIFYDEEAPNYPSYLRTTDLNGQIIEEVELSVLHPDIDVNRMLWTPDYYLIVSDSFLYSFDGARFELLAILEGYDISDLVFIPD